MCTKGEANTAVMSQSGGGGQGPPGASGPPAPAQALVQFFDNSEVWGQASAHAGVPI